MAETGVIFTPVLTKFTNMKKVVLAALLLLPVLSFAQSIQKDAKGNYITVKAKRDSVPDTNTGKTFTDSKGKVWPVYETKTGRVYAWRTSASGKKYKQYLDKKSN